MLLASNITNLDAAASIRLQFRFEASARLRSRHNSRQNDPRRVAVEIRQDVVLALLLARFRLVRAAVGCRRIAAWG